MSEGMIMRRYGPRKTGDAITFDDNCFAIIAHGSGIAASSINGSYSMYDNFKSGDELIINASSVNGFQSMSASALSLPQTRVVSSSGQTSNPIGCFMAATSLKAADLPECSAIHTNAFKNCTALQNINMPKVSIIHPSAFSNCINLTNVYIPECSFIGTAAFYNCSNLTELKIGHSDCTLQNTNAFTGTKLSQSGQMNIKVPSDRLDYYSKSATNWSTYSNFMEGY